MAAPTERKPLDRFAVIRTDDVDEMRDVIARFYGDVRLTVGPDFDNFHGYGNHWQLSDVGISYASFGAAVGQFYPELSDSFATTVAIAGSGMGRGGGSKIVGVDDRHSFIGSPGSPAELHCGSGYEDITVQLDASAVKRTLAALIGAEVNGNLSFDPVFDLEKAENQLWWRLVLFLINEAEMREDDLPLAALGEIEQALIVMFLKANRHNFSYLLDGRHPDAAPRQVRLAEEYIEANWYQPITIEQLARLTAVSARSLFQSFRKSRGYSPMAFVKQVRLRHARQTLLSSGPGTSVARVANQCGFGNLGNFAKDYRMAFGELPSETLRSA